MTWECTLLDVIGTRQVRYDPPKGSISGETFLLFRDGTIKKVEEIPAGGMFFVPETPVIEGEKRSWIWPWGMASDERLSDYYKANNAAKRRPLMVILPGRQLFLVDGKCWSNGSYYGGWSVTGDAPRITVSPSINLVGSYHGWIADGCISDDCEGRRFTEDGDSL